MGHPKTAKEQRREQRVPARLQIQLSIGEGDAGDDSEQSSAINISSNGVYFKSRRYLAPLTMLGLRIQLPGERGRGQVQTLDVRGVVVRIEPEDPRADVNSYEVACFFTDTTPEFRERLGRYVQSHL